MGERLDSEAIVRLLEDWLPDLGKERTVGPFTDFGQFGYGKIDKRVLEQDIYWVDIAGTPMFLVDMPADYLRNVIDYLMTKAPDWWSAELAWLTAVIVLLAASAAPPQVVHRFAEHMDALQRTGADEWMRSTPLMRRLQELVAPTAG
jgi:hypothetical protein